MLMVKHTELYGDTFQCVCLLYAFYVFDVHGFLAYNYNNVVQMTTDTRRRFGEVVG